MNNRHTPKIPAVMAHSDAEAMMERFLSGETSMAEERLLYSYFTAGSVADSLKPYITMMSWYAEGLKPAKPKAGRSFMPSRQLLLWCISTAAMIALIATVGISFHHQAQIESELYSAYHGSYIVRNGHTITDINDILPELQIAEHLTDRIADNEEAELDRINNDIFYSDSPEIASIKRAVFADIFSD
ncbi:MAG: hypothetical protein NC043_06410 [Muribaculaceae bacterium]|nr:hypothetical protein [Muribaculaceae bacterium]